MSNKVLVPKTVKFYSRKPTKIKDLRGEELEVYPSFPTDDSAARNATASAWTERRNGKEPLPDSVTCENLFKSLQITDLDVRGEGGRAYQVVLKVGDRSVLVDLREDCLLDCMAQVGMKPNGIIESDFSFCISGSQFKLYRIGSDEYNKLIATQELVKVTKPEVGGVYQDKFGNYFKFLGYVKKQDVIETKPTHYAWNRKSEYSLSENKVKYQAWIKMNLWQVIDNIAGFFTDRPELKFGYYHFDFAKSKTCYEIVDAPDWVSSELYNIDWKKAIVDTYRLSLLPESDRNLPNALELPVTPSHAYLAISQMEWMT